MFVSQFGSHTLKVKLRLLPGRNTVQVRGSPPFHPGVAQQRQQQFRKLPGINAPRKCKSSRRLQTLNAPVAQLPKRDASNVGDAGEIPAGSAILPRWPNYQRRSAQDGEVGGGSPSRGTNFGLEWWSSGLLDC